MSDHEPSSFETCFEEGARRFDEGAFFEAHELWERGWRLELDQPRRRLLQGLIQIAAGFHKLFEVQAVESAARLLARGVAKLDACPTEVTALGLSVFRAEVHAWGAALAVAAAGLGPPPVNLAPGALAPGSSSPSALAAGAVPRIRGSSDE
jgi:predicted metal-dependent hydrolase